MTNQPIPGASNALTFGILSIVLTLFCCGPFGAIFSFIALSNAKKAEVTYQQDPEIYTGYENIKTSTTLAYIGLVLSAVLLVFTIIYFGVIIAIFTTGNF
jgi:flagellar basal body-associated protein FliL